MSNLIANDDPLLYDLDYSNLNSGQQAQINALIEVSSELIEKYCNRIFELTTFTEEKHHGKNENQLFINNPPIVTLTTVAIVGSETTEYDGTLFAYNEKTGEITWDANYLLQNVVDDWVGSFPSGFNNILVTYDGGFSTIPAPVKWACADLISQSFSPEEGFGNIEFEKLGQYFYRLNKNKMDEVLLGHKKILNMYKLHRVSE